MVSRSWSEARRRSSEPEILAWGVAVGVEGETRASEQDGGFGRRAPSPPRSPGSCPTKGPGNGGRSTRKGSGPGRETEVGRWGRGEGNQSAKNSWEKLGGREGTGWKRSHSRCYRQCRVHMALNWEALSLTAQAVMSQAQTGGPGSGGVIEPPNVGSWACPGGFGEQSRVGHGPDVLGAQMCSSLGPR